MTEHVDGLRPAVLTLPVVEETVTEEGARVTDLHALPALAFGVEVKRLRKASRMSQERLGELIHYTGAMVSYIETGQRVPPEPLVSACDMVFQTDGLLTRLGTLVREFGHPTAPLPELLGAARSLRMADPLLVPSLLQTDDYAHALLRASNVPSAETERLLEERPRLTTLLDTSPELHAWLIVDETVLYRPVGGGATLRGQLKDILELADTGRLVVQLLPATSPAVALLRVPLVLLSFAEGADVALLGEAGMADPVERYGDAEWHGRHYDLLRAAARTCEQSLAAIRAAVRM